MMQKLKEVGYLEKGMVLVDVDGKEGKVTGLYGDNDFMMVEFDNNQNRRILWDWENLSDRVYVRR
ncbi:hypothetical protein QNH23_06365 [Siminovitchia fortis]|nr:hypothetical protein [Siminovitchia fortis]WHY82995.1 hypothetical protein QNH23_06365 [Siminovitchia fortis]